MSIADSVNRIFREFNRYTGDGLPGEPTNAALPIGDPQSGPYNPKKSELRGAFNGILGGIETSVEEVQDAADRAEAAAALATSATGRLSFRGVPDLLADTTLVYAVAPGKVAVGANDVVEAQGFRYAVAPSGSSDYHVATAGGVRLYALPGMHGFDVKQWGASPGVANNSPLIEGAMTYAAAVGRPLDLGPKGVVWPCTGVVAPSVAGKRLELIGEARLLFSGSGYLNISGTVTDVTYVATAVSKGAKTFVVNNASGFAVGDVIAIEDTVPYSFSASQFRPDYHAGDIAEIVGISGNSVTLGTRLRDKYPAAATSKVFKLTPVELITSAFEVEASNTPTGAVLVSCAVNSVLNLHSRGGSDRAAFYTKMWRSEGHRGRHIHTAPDTGNNYGLVVGNSQDCNFYDFYMYGTRRGVATGTGGGAAGVPMRNVFFIGGSSENGNDLLGSADFHGDADGCGFIGHEATFFDIGGRDCKVIDCFAAPRNVYSPVSFTEYMGGKVEIRNLTVTRGPGATFTDIVSGRNGTELAKIKENYAITVDGITVADGTSLITAVSFLHAAASPVRASVFVDNVNILGGTVAANFRLLNSSVSNIASHPGGVAAPVSLEVGDHCVWPFANSHSWLLTSGTHTGCRVSAPSTTFPTSFFVGSAASASTPQNFNFVGYPFAPMCECQPYGLSSAAGVMLFGVIDSATAGSVTANITSGKSTDTAGGDRTVPARVKVSMDGAISP